MKAEEIIKFAARNLNLLSSDNLTIMNGVVTRAGMLDELNRIYTTVIGQYLIEKLKDEFIVEARRPLYRSTFTVASVDIINNIITATQGAFGTADEGYYIFNPIDGSKLKIDLFISSTQVKTKQLPNISWVGQQIYSLTPVIQLDGDMEDAKDIVKVQIRRSQNDYWQNLEYTTISNLRDLYDNNQIQVSYKPMYCITSIKINDTLQRVIRYAPEAVGAGGMIKVNYTEAIAQLKYEDTPRYENMGITDVLINGLTAWGFRTMSQYEKAQVFEESNSAMGGIVPRGLTLMNQKLSPQSNKIINFRNVWRIR